jgi:hypothetical protein
LLSSDHDLNLPSSNTSSYVDLTISTMPTISTERSELPYHDPRRYDNRPAI